MCCGVLQCVAVCVAVCCIAASYSVLQCVAVCYSLLQCVAVCCSVLQFLQGDDRFHYSAFPVRLCFMCVYVCMCQKKSGGGHTAGDADGVIRTGHCCQHCYTHTYTHTHTHTHTYTHIHAHARTHAHAHAHAHTYTHTQLVDLVRCILKSAC